jgi:hypothetical protein
LFHLPSRSLFECSCEIVPIHFALVINNLKLLSTLTKGLFLIITNKFNDRENIFSCCIANECFKFVCNNTGYLINWELAIALVVEILVKIFCTTIVLINYNSKQPKLTLTGTIFS